MTTTTSTAGFQPKLFTPGDWNAFFGFGTNILTNMLTLTILLRFVIKMPDSDCVRPHPACRRPDVVPVDVLLRVSRLPARQKEPAAAMFARCRPA